MVNQSADHALRAVLFLAQRDGRWCSADAVAKGIGVPRNYLGKVLHTLARAGVLASVRGPRGGFRLAVPPERISLDAVVEPFQRLPDRRVCLLGDRPCDARHPCSVHQRWRRMAEPIMEFFRGTTVALLLRPLEEAAAAPAGASLMTFVPQPAAAAPARQKPSR